MKLRPVLLTAVVVVVVTLLARAPLGGQGLLVHEWASKGDRRPESPVATQTGQRLVVTQSPRIYPHPMILATSESAAAGVGAAGFAGADPLRRYRAASPSGSRAFRPDV